LRRRALLLPLVLTCALPTCRQIADIGPITYVDAGGGGDVVIADVVVDAGCPSGTALYTTAQSYDIIEVESGFIYGSVASAGVFRCATTGCASPTTIVNQNNTFIAYSLGPSVLYYTIQPNQTGGPTMGSLHSANLDGTNDQTVAGNLDYPFWIAVTGNDIFWSDDSQDLAIPGTTPATIECIGCNGVMTSKPWITGLSNTYGLIADTTNVWVFADDGTGTVTSEVLVCPIAAPCVAASDGGTGAKVVLGKIPTPTTLATQANQLGNYIAGDGTYFYVVNGSSIQRVNAAGVSTTIVPGVSDIVAITVDVAAGNLYYATDGTVFRTKADGSGPSTPVVCNQSGISDIAVDSQNVYFVTTGTANPNGAPYYAPK